MDGLKISVNDSKVTPDFNISRSNSKMNGEEVSASVAKSGGSDFATTLRDAIGSVDQLQKVADVKMQELATGKSTNLHETMIATEKADIALRLMVQVRNKIVEAYQEIMRMQV